MKKLLAFALSLSLILACMTGITLTASAATLDGEGTDASPFIIDSAEKFAAVFSNGSTADLTKVYLVTGFDQTAMDLPSTYVADTVNKFSGKLLGGNLVDNEIVPVVQKINLGTYTTGDANFIGDSASSCYQGVLFNEIAGATISHFELSGSVSVPSIKNCAFGVVVGRIASAGKVMYVTNRADVDGLVWSSQSALAGLVGTMASGMISNSSNYGDITLNKTYAYQCAGIVGKISKGVTVRDCFNYGTISSKCEAAGIVAWSAENTLNRVGNYGKINTTTSTGGAYWEASGILGRAGGAITINDSFNLGDITAITYAGPFVGISGKYTVTVNNCLNAGAITATTSAGLITGSTTTGYTLNINNFYDIGNPGLAAISGTNAGTINQVNAFSYGTSTSDATATAIKKVSIDTIAGLTETVDAFKDSTVWIKSGAYGYPVPAANNPGFGTKAPCPIFTLADLKNISNNPSSSYKLMADISGVDEMLCVETPFSGVFDGNGKTITIDIDTTDIEVYPKFVGLFKLATGTLKNVNIAGTLDAGYIDWQGGAGALVGKISTDTFLVENCANYATVNSTGHQTAGLVGRAENKGKITKCKNYGDVTASVKASGIVGLTVSTGGYLTDNANYGNITGGSYAAGICSWTYTWNWMGNTFNVGTITALAEGGKACGLYGNMTGSQNVNKSFNAGALIGDITYGIGEINSSNTKNSAIKDCYNAVGADYPIANNHTTWATLSKEYNYYLADESQADDGTDNTIVVNSKDDLKTISLTASFGIVSGSPYVYPQVIVNPIDTDYADIDFSLVTVTDNTDDNTTVSIWACDDAKFYAVDGSEVTVKAAVSDEDFYEAYVNGEKVVDGEATVTVNGDTAITITDEKAEYVTPETLGNTVYAFNSDEKGAITLRGEEYTRYSLIFAKANKVTGLKRVEFGVYFGEDENISADNYKLKAVAESERISSEGAYGVLLYTEEGAGGFVNGRNYYVLPYSVYVDVDGTEYIVTGTTQTFSFNN